MLHTLLDEFILYGEAKVENVLAMQSCIYCGIFVKTIEGGHIFMPRRKKIHL